MKKPRIYTTSFANVYPLYVAKAEKKARTKGEVDEVIRWLTGYSQLERKAPGPREAAPAPSTRCGLYGEPLMRPASAGAADASVMASVQLAMYTFAFIRPLLLDENVTARLSERVQAVPRHAGLRHPRFDPDCDNLGTFFAEARTRRYSSSASFSAARRAPSVSTSR